MPGSTTHPTRSVLAVLLAAGSYCAAQPNPPVVTSPEWFTWYADLLSQRLGECPRDRSQSYYFSQAGDDLSGDGSIVNPWKTLNKARQVLSEAPVSGDVALFFRRGDTWRDTVGLDVPKPHITIGDYGTGEKPLFTTFHSVGDPGLWAPTPGFTNVYQRPSSPRVMWAKQDGDLDRPWSRQRTISGVSKTEGSWCWLKGVLYIHPRHAGAAATDPRVDGNSYETAEETFSPGVRVHRDGCRIENIRAQGWGITVQPGTQIHGIESQVQNSDRAVIIGCESHYGLTHVMTHWSGTGGIATFVECKAGLTTYSAGGGETIFNTFSHWGGCETVFDHCEATHGTLPSDDFPAGLRKGASMYGHTGLPTARLGLTIAYACSTRDTPHGSAGAIGFSDVQPAQALAGVRCFIVGEHYAGGPGEFWRLGDSSTVKVNGLYMFRPRSGDSFTNHARGWTLNCTINLDCTQVPGDFAFFRTSPGSPSSVQVWNSEIRILTRPGQTFRFDGASVPSSSASIIGHSIIVCEGGGATVPNLGLPPPARRRRGQPAWPLKSNAYFGVDVAAVVKDPYAVLLTSVPASGSSLSCGSPLACGAADMFGAIVMGYDQRKVAGYRNDIGPIEAFICANCDGSTAAPVLNALDFTCFMTKYTTGDTAVNCDGSTVAPVLNAQDFICFQDAFVRGCR
jgi:hypothetical protein